MSFSTYCRLLIASPRVACPSKKGNEMMEPIEREKLLRIYAEARTIAVVGASADVSKAAHQVPRYLQSQGFRILPVNPRGGEIFGEKVFRPAQEASEIARQAIAIKARYFGFKWGACQRKPGR